VTLNDQDDIDLIGQKTGSTFEDLASL